MKKAFAALVLGTSLMGTAVFAGSLSDPVIEPIEIINDATSSSSGTTLVALLAILMAIPALD